jgi:hypothetical protein
MVKQAIVLKRLTVLRLITRCFGWLLSWVAVFRWRASATSDEISFF